MLIQPFHSKGTPGTEAIVVVFDLEGFSRFFAQPDVHLYAPDYLNVVFNAVQSIWSIERPYWLTEELDQPIFRADLREPTFAKFMGDGGFYIWTAPDPLETITEGFKLSLLQMLWALKRRFWVVTKHARDVVPVPRLPERIRFGVTRGTVYGLRRAGIEEPVDYVGFAINLAARLQSYCREIGFVASARLMVQHAQKAAWHRVTATSIKGFTAEDVYVDFDEFNELDPKVRKSLFAEIAAAE